VYVRAFLLKKSLNRDLHLRWTPTCERRSSWKGSGRRGQRNTLAARLQTTARETERQMGFVIFTTVNVTVLCNSYFGSWTLYKWLYCEYIKADTNAMQTGKKKSYDIYFLAEASSIKMSLNVSCSIIQYSTEAWQHRLVCEKNAPE